MATNPHIGFGALIQKGDGQSPENFITIMGVKGITGPDISRDAVETTDMQSAQWREFIGGLVNAGEVGFEANLLVGDESQGQEEGGFLAEFDKSSCDSRGRFRIVLPECGGEAEGYFEFDGVVTGSSIQIPLDDVMGFSGTIKVSGRPNLVLATT